MQEEMRAHLELQAEANRAGGMDAEEARYAALRQFGGVTQVQERCREQRGLRWLEDLGRDLTFAVRSFARTPGFTVTVVATLALGIGLNTGIFSLFKSIALRPLPGVPASQELVALYWSTPGGDQMSLSHLDLRDLRERCRSFRGLEGTAPLPLSVQLDGRAQRVWGEYATGGEQGLLGAEAALGRMLVLADDARGGAPVAVVSHRFWRSRLGGDPHAVGRPLVVNGQPFTLVGVAKPGFVGSTVGFALDLFLPAGQAGRMRIYGAAPDDPYEKRDFQWLGGLGRLRPGVSLDQARAEVETVAAALVRENPAALKDKRLHLVNIRRSPFGAQTYFGPMLGVLMGMTGLVLLIMCANVASLLLARATVRSREIAIRLAVGAGRGRVVRQLLTESLLLAVVGGVLGAWLACATPELMARLVPSNRFPVMLNTEADAAVLAFSLAVSLGSALVFGLVPALQATRPDLVPTLKGERAAGGVRRLFGRNALVVVQIAVSLPLLVAAGLLWRSYRNEQRADFGFAAREVALLSFDLGSSGYTPEQAREFCARLLEEAAKLPGVESASLAQLLPLRIVPGLETPVEVEGHVRGPAEASLVLYNVVSRDYFDCLRIGVVRGREFTARDDERSTPVAVVNETFAQRYWKGQDPVGRRFTMGGVAREVVGVVRDIKYLNPAEEARPHFYLPTAQQPATELVLQLRGTGDPRQWCRAAQQRIAQLDPSLPVFGVETMDDYLGFALAMQSIAALVLGLAAALGLLLAALGTFGLVSFTVGSRSREIGVRVALGASRASILRLVMGHGLWLAAAGAAIGLVGALVATRFMRNLLFGVEPTDLVTLAGAFLVVAGMVAAACWLPARRALRIDPAGTLRSE